MTERQKDALAITVCVAVALVAVVVAIVNIHVLWSAFPVLWRTYVLVGGVLLLGWSTSRVMGL